MSHSHSNSNPFDDDENLPYTLDSTYWDPGSQPTPASGSSVYEPPAEGDLLGPEPTAGDDAFAAGSQAAASGHGVVPSVSAGGEASGAGRAGGNNHVVLQFEETAAPAAGVSGRIGSPAPALENYKPTRALLPRDAPRSADGLSDAGRSDDAASYSLFNIKRYRRYFNVDTEDVLSRITDSVVGFWRADFMEKTTNNADLYGPFWIATTLVFVSAVTGNYASYLSYRHKHSGDASTSGSDKVWFYDINKVSYSAVLYYGYIGVIGLLVWGVLKYFKSGIALAQIWCTYGYALTIFIPISFFCIFPLEALRWSLVGVATATSGLFIMANLRQPIFENAGAKALPVYLSMGGLHLALGLVMKLYFFHYW